MIVRNYKIKNKKRVNRQIKRLRMDKRTKMINGKMNKTMKMKGKISGVMFLNKMENNKLNK